MNSPAQVSQVQEPVSKIRPVPKVGDTLVVLHEVKRDKSSQTVLGLQRNARPEKTKITAVFLDGSVRNNNSDVWKCKPGKLGEWETVNPDLPAKG